MNTCLFSFFSRVTIVSFFSMTSCSLEQKRRIDCFFKTRHKLQTCASVRTIHFPSFVWTTIVSDLKDISDFQRICLYLIHLLNPGSDNFPYSPRSRRFVIGVLLVRAKKKNRLFFQNKTLVINLRQRATLRFVHFLEYEILLYPLSFSNFRQLYQFDLYLCPIVLLYQLL